MGCFGWDSLPPKKFSGKFVVVNYFSKKVVIKDWEGFDSACPLRGIFSLGVEKSASFDWQDKIPKTVAVLWREECDTELKKQEIELHGVIPAGVKGTTRFELSKDGDWKVSFETQSVASP
jgi:hypothetical protein